MATNWTIHEGSETSSIGPKWEAMESSTLERWEDLTEHYWGWIKTWKVEIPTKMTNGPTWDGVDGLSSISDEWEDLTNHYWDWGNIWTFSGKTTTRDSD